jgi:hypothetical protein
MENFNLKKFLVENKLTTNSKLLNESDVIDFKFTEIGNQKAGDLRNEMIKQGLKVDVKIDNETYPYKASNTGTGWDAQEKISAGNAYLFAGKPENSILIGIDKSTNKAQDILKYIEGNFKENYSITKGASGDKWEIKIQPK